MNRALPFQLRKRPRMVRYDGDENCSICLNPLKSSKMVKRLPCGHMFHGPCISKWTQLTCPMCRQQYKYVVFHAPPFKTCWWFESLKQDKVPQYCGPANMDEYNEYWEDIDDGFVLDSNREWRDKPRTFYYRVLRQLKRHVRRKRRQQEEPTIINILNDVLQTSMDYERLFRILEIPAEATPSIEIPTLEFSDDLLVSPLELNVAEPPNFPRIFDIARPVTERLFETSSNLMPVFDRPVGEYFSLNLTTENSSWSPEEAQMPARVEFHFEPENPDSEE